MRKDILYLNFLFIAIFSILGLNSNAQTGPGGVGNKDGTSGQPTNKIWFDASSLSLSNTDPVATWTDRSGNINDADQVIVARQPEFRTGQINGLPAVIFDPSGPTGNEDFIPFDGSVIASSDYSVIFVAQRRSSDGRQVVMGGTNTGANNNLHIYWQNNSNFRAHHWSNDLSTPMVANSETYSDGNDANEYGIFTTRLGSTEGNPQRRNYQNNYYLGGLNANTQLNSWDGAAIARFNPGTAEYTDIDVAEVLIYSTAINAAQLQIVHNYLSEKYNITIDADKYAPIAAYSHDVSGIGMESNEKHTRAASAGFYVYENSGTLANDEYVFFSHNSTANSTVTTDLPAGVEERWARDWYLDKINTTDVDIKLVFDLPEGITGGNFPGIISDYTLLYRNSTSGNYSEVAMATAVSLGDADQIEFTLANGEYSDGYFTLGTTDQTTSPVVGIAGKTWYALISGNWDNWEVWTLDPSGMLPNNPGHDVPANIDKVVIHSGKKITVQAASGTISIVGITVEGKLDLQNLAVHNFSEINGSGKIMMSADNFPNGDATNFYTKGQGEGSVRYYGTGYTLATNREFFDVEIIQTNNTDIVIQTSNYTINGDFTIETGIWQINDATDDAIRNLTVKGDVLVQSTGQITVGTGNTFAADGYNINTGSPKMPEDDGKDYHSIFHQFEVYGNFTNNGTINLTNQAAPVYNELTTSGGVTLRMKGAENKVMSLNGVTNLYNLIIDRGADKTYIQTITSSNTANFTLFGANSVGRTNAGGYTSENPQIRKALWIYNGTLKLIGAINIPTLSEGNDIGGNGDYAIGQNACLWIADAGVTVYSTASATSQVPAGASGVRLNSSNQAMSVFGKFRISDGFFGTRNSAGFIFWADADAQVHIEGGTTDVAQIRSAGSGGVASYNQTAGLMRCRGNETEAGEYTGGYPLFGLDNSDAVFQMSGGKILLRDEDGDEDPEIYLPCASGNYSVTGGTVTIDIRQNRDFQISSTVPFWNLEIINHDAAGNVDVQLETDITVQNDLTVGVNCTLDSKTPVGYIFYDLTIGKTLNLNGTYIPYTNSTNFIHTSNDIAINIASGTVTNGFHDILVTLDDDSNATIDDDIIIRNNLTVTDGVFHDGGNIIEVHGNINNQQKISGSSSGKVLITKGGVVTNFTITNDGGNTYTSAPTATIDAPGGGGTTALAVVVINGAVQSVTVVDGGIYDRNNPAVRFSAPANGTTAVGNVNMTDLGGGQWTVASITITDPGSGYQTAPTVSVRGGSTSGAYYRGTFTANILGNITDVVLTDNGTTYTAIPSVTITGAATATATVNLKHELNAQFRTQYRNVELDESNTAIQTIMLEQFTATGTFTLTNGIWDADIHRLSVWTEPVLGLPFSATKMIRTAGNKSDGGLSYTYGRNSDLTSKSPILYPIGTGTVYTPAEFTCNGVLSTSHNNRLSIAPVSVEHPAVNTSGEALTYYWEIDNLDTWGHQITLPGTVPYLEYKFYYDQNDLPATYPGDGVTGGDDGDGNLNTCTATCADTKYEPGYFDGSTWTTTDPNTNIEGANKFVIFNGNGAGIGAVPAGGFTAGCPDHSVIGTLPEFYSIADGEWNNAGGTIWSNTEGGLALAPGTEPGSLNKVHIQHEITIVQNNKSAYSVTLYNKQSGQERFLDATTTTGHDFGTVYGAGTPATPASNQRGQFRIASPNLPTADWIPFCQNTYANFRYYGGSYTLPNTIKQYPQLQIYDNGAKTLPSEDFKAFRLVLEDDAQVYFNNTAGGDLTINRNHANGGGTGGGLDVFSNSQLIFQNTGTARTLTVESGIRAAYRGTGGNEIIVETGAGDDLVHKMYVVDDINFNRGKIDLYGTGESVVDLYMIGLEDDTHDATIENSEYEGATPNANRHTEFIFNKLIIDKGTDQTITVTMEADFTLPTTATSEANLQLLNGTFIMNDQTTANGINTDIVLSSGDADFPISGTTAFEIHNGEVNVLGDNTGIGLDGRLLIAGGTVDMANGAGNGNNYIEYSSSGNAELEISSGSLSVGSQIRRSTQIEEGILTYNQSGGTVAIGVNSAPENSRGVFEILNAGSSFTHSAGSFTIVRQQINPSIASFYFDPETAVLSNGTVITIGNASTPANQNITAYINKPIKNLLLDNSSSNNLKFTLESVNAEIQEDLTISTGTQFDANSLQLTMSGGDFINNGIYTHNNNLVLFNGNVAQEIQGTSATTFFQLTKQATKTLTLQNNIIIEDDMKIDAGIIADNNNEISLYGDMHNTAEHTYGGSGNGISFLGTTNQKVYGNGGIYGKISINNHNGVKLDVGTDEIFVNNAVQLEAGVFDIGENLLTLRINAVFIPQSPYSATNMVQTNSSISDSGVKKYFPAGTGIYFCPIGAAGKYTPVKVTSTNNTSITGNLTIKAADEVHPTITEDAEAPDTEITDNDNALQFYWTLIADDFTDVTGTVEMFYYPSDVATTAPYTIADYITAKLLNDGSGNWNHYDWADFDEVAEKLIFSFNTPVADAEISGDYTAGAEPNSANRLGAIPNQVPGYISIKDGDWTDITTWDTYPTSGGTIPVGGPDGAMVIIDAPSGVPHTVVMNQNYISSYTTEIRGILQQKLTFGNRLGILKGQGTLSTERGSLPAGYYPEFLAETGGTLEYTGTDSYDILAQITELNNLVLSGSGDRLFPNLDVQILGTFTIKESAQVNNDNNRRISVKKDVTFDGGTFMAGTGTSSVFEFNGTSPQTVLGTGIGFVGSNAFYNIEMNNAFGLTLENPVDIDNELVFTTGVIHTTTTNILTLENPLETVVSGAGIGKYVDGPLNKKITLGGDFTFPIGNAGRYGKAGLNNVSNTSDAKWQAQYYNHNPNDDSYDPSVFVAPLKIISENEYWRIKGPTSETAQVRLRWDSNNGGFAGDAHRNDMRIAEWRDETTDAWYQVDAGNTISGDANAGTISSTVSSSFNEFGIGNIFTISTVYSIVNFTWDGSESITWEDGDNWSGTTVPSAMDNAIIPDAMPHDPTISSVAACNELTIASNTTVTINAGYSLTTNGDFSNAGILLLKSPTDNTASASFIDNGVITGAGKIHVERYMEANKFHYVSSPIKSGATGNATSNLFTMHPSGNFNPNFYTYDETYDLDGNPATAPLNPDDGSNTFNSDNLVPGWTYAHNSDNGATPIALDEKTGYAFWTDMGQTITFIGDANTGDFNFNGLTYTNNDAQAGPLPNYYDGWNLVSNPYPSSIDWDLIKGTRTDLDNGIYIWDGTQYASYSNDVKGGSMALSNEVAPMQAFFVHSTANNNPSFQLNNSHRVHSSVKYLKGEEEENVKPNFIRLKMQANGYSDYSVIYFKSNATIGFDGSFDAFKLYSPSYMPTIPHIYSVTTNDATPLSINALPENTMDNLIIPLHIKIGQAGTYTISLDEFNFENDYVYFIDKQENVEVCLNIETLTDYSFTCGSGIISDRFELRFFENNAPVIQDEILVQSVLEDEQFEFTISQNSFIETDLNDEIVSYTATLANGEVLPTWLNFNNETLTFSGQATNDEVGIVEIKVEVADRMGATASQIFSITVINTNDAPTLEIKIPDMKTSTSELYTYSITENTFMDVDLGDILTYSANLEGGNSLPEWLYFNNETSSFYGTPTIAEVLNIEVTASDIDGEYISDIFELTITGVNTVSNLSGFNYKIYPNPAKDVINLEFEGLNVQKITIFDITGKLILKKTKFKQKGIINISNFNRGLYFINIQTDNEIITTKIIKK